MTIPTTVKKVHLKKTATLSVLCPIVVVDVGDVVGDASFLVVAVESDGFEVVVVTVAGTASFLVVVIDGFAVVVVTFVCAASFLVVGEGVSLLILVGSSVVDVAVAAPVDAASVTMGFIIKVICPSKSKAMQTRSILIHIFKKSFCLD